MKIEPPTIAIVYHLENRKNERFIHEILLEKRMVETMDNKEIASHLFNSEPYYMNPKNISRPQITGIVKKLKEGLQKKI
jgi:hypothetical protein